MKPNTTGLKRIFNATGYSFQGLRAAWNNEAAFRQELVLLVVMTTASFFLPVTQIEQLLMVATLFLVVIVELINSAIEAVVDRIGPEHHELSGRAKDIGSAAVFVALLLVGVTWGSILLF
ncbi:diacylglycerol kinase [Grimontia hollisae]|uniref:Diacylglycerol kinase n=2 Tax=Grimontia hollisae TaxID=673 RepID=D0I8S1_GRIHO|nr:diacylglycerol kinase [Grimontia hollisae]AMG28952.1 diacylglycerol kinase [Grimontia hollisae]EEY71836.1 diacylglycerol kinase [Grimontia hollisae CIP 101886]MDF2184757.1 diacylglycerol kinase [Grimontia hollisae]STO77192.1 Diacylglycerol kinase [Grimontia hollisae]STQ75834.1 Diacylglycerol kinase [Grimontia hollisae]